MLDDEELLFDKLYEKTEDCGRIQFIKLLMGKERENQKLKEKYENAVADYETAMAEKEQLKKQLEDKEDYINKLQATKDKLDKWDYENAMQQKEFIKYMNSCIKELEKESPNKLQNTINLGIIDITKTILQKYKEIIGDDK